MKTEQTATPPTNYRQLVQNDPELLQSVRNMEQFIALFTPGKMEEELWQLACRFYEKNDETAWTPAERHNVYAMYNMLIRICRSIKQIVDELSPQ